MADPTAPSVPRHADALVLAGPRQLVRRRLAIPALSDDDAVLEIEACGLCGTDHEQFTGALFPGFAFIPGHEIVGRIADIGPAAAARWGVSQGDRVAVEVFLKCGRCAACASDHYRRCVDHGMADMYGFKAVDIAPGLWGGYATHLYLAPDSLVLPVPAGLPAGLATVFNPLGAGIRWAVTLPDLQPGAAVAVLGPGIRGLCAAAAAKDAGAATVMVTGVGPADDDRLALAPSFGADLVVDVSRHDPVKRLRDATGSLADVVIDVTANSPDAYEQALRLARPGGTVVVAGTRGDQRLTEHTPDIIVYKELTVIGALGVDAPAYETALRVLADGRFPFADLPREVVGLDAAADLISRMAGGGPRPVHGVIDPRR